MPEFEGNVTNVRVEVSDTGSAVNTIEAIGRLSEAHRKFSFVALHIADPKQVDPAAIDRAIMKADLQDVIAVTWHDTEDTETQKKWEESFPPGEQQ